MKHPSRVYLPPSVVTENTEPEPPDLLMRAIRVVHNGGRPDPVDYYHCPECNMLSRNGVHKTDCELLRDWMAI